ncbi:MAG: branched-chain amino acid aminotransferase [Phycisphaerae bacterium SM23_30]|nr:MAG: branched-chain amino acid aminotransferase [Phycisphaerae bacterium SM23_30]
MGLKIWMNNGLVEEAEAKISLFDHGLLYGDGIFEGIRVYGGKVFQLEAHLERLYTSAQAICLQVKQDPQTLTGNILKTVEANRIVEGYIRLIVTRGVGTLGHNPLVCKDSQIIIVATTIQLYPPETYEKGLKVISANTIRMHPQSLSPQIKSLNYLNNILAKLEALKGGADEAVMYNHLGCVAEGTADNLFIVKKKIVLTPPHAAGALIGITRQVVMKLAVESSYEMREKDLTRFDLHTADEMFLTGTAAEVIGVVQIDGRQIGNGKPGPVTKELREKYLALTKSGQ